MVIPCHFSANQFCGPILAPEVTQSNLQLGTVASSSALCICFSALHHATDPPAALCALSFLMGGAAYSLPFSPSLLPCGRHCFPGKALFFPQLPLTLKADSFSHSPWWIRLLFTFFFTFFPEGKWWTLVQLGYRHPGHYSKRLSSLVQHV